MNGFRVGDRVRNKRSLVQGTVTKLVPPYVVEVLFDHPTWLPNTPSSGPVSTHIEKLEFVPEEKKAELRCTHKSCRLCRDAAERAELRGWAKGVSDMAAAEKKDEDQFDKRHFEVSAEHGALVDDMRDLLESWLETFDKKQRAYGPKAIGNAPLGAAEGLLNRIHDKYSRLVQLMQNPDVDDLGEATADTVKDMGIYCAMLVLVNEGKWPGV